ncbi:MAG: ABC transporter permease [Candidatus Thermoplasmatota archaeon]|nr:ABC transporter permease [Candidatus Thermoplasmatota archaeon]
MTENVSAVVEMERKLPGSPAQSLKIAKYEMLNYMRSRRFLVLLVVDAVIGAILTGIVAYYRPQAFLGSMLGFYALWWGNVASFVVILSCIFFGGDAISGEFQNRTGYFIMANPIRRSSVYVGKFIGAFISSLIILVFFFVITIANGIYYFGASIPAQLAESLLFSVIYLLSVLGFTFFFSSLFRSSVTSVILTAILFLFVFTTVQTFVSSFVGVEPWFLITYGAGIITNIFTVPYPSHMTKTVERFGRHATVLTTYIPTVAEGLVIMAAYFIISSLLGLYLFERSEFR